MLDAIDIYLKLDTKINETDFWEVDIDEQKKIIEKILKTYLLDDTKQEKIIPDSITLLDLLDLLSDELKENNRFDIITDYILELIADIQGYPVKYIEGNTMDIKTTELGNWESITIDRTTNPLAKFHFIYDNFQNNFLKKQLQMNK